MPVEAEIERLGAGLHPGEMAVEIGDALDGIEAHRLDEVEAPGRRHKLSLRQAFAPFVAGIAVRHDRGAEAEPGHALAGLQHQRPYRDIERRIAVRRKTADRAAIRAARRGFESRDDLHRPDLGRAGDRAAGEDRREDVDRAEAVLELGGDGRGHLEDGRIGLDREQFRHLDAARPGDAGEVVAQQIDDHQILGALLGVGGEHGADRRRAARCPSSAWR